MRTRKASAKSIAALITQLNDKQLLALADNPRRVREFATLLVKEEEEKTYVWPISDMNMPWPIVGKCRKMASDWGCTSPIFWGVRAGHTIKHHAPKSGPCKDDFSSLQKEDFEDMPTKGNIVFWIPQLAPESTRWNVDEQLAKIKTFQICYDLPLGDFSSFGEASLLSGLVLAHFNQTGVRVPREGFWARTDSRLSSGPRIALGDFRKDGLRYHKYFDSVRDRKLGCFVVGTVVM